MAILDRLLHHCEVISINGPSYRLKNRLKAIERETKWPDIWGRSPVRNATAEQRPYADNRLTHGARPVSVGESGVGRLSGFPVRGGAAPVVEAGAGDAEDGAQPLHAVAAVVVGNELEAVQEPSVNYGRFWCGCCTCCDMWTVVGISEEDLAVLDVKFAALLPHLDERQRRLYLGSEAEALGHGGIMAVARLAEVSESTIARGCIELAGGTEPLGRVRRPGGGRRSAAERDPGLRPALEALIEPREVGDPVSPLRWTTASLRDLARELSDAGHPVSAPVVGGLLREMGFSLQGMAKTRAGSQSPDRDAQFRHINAAAELFLARGLPVVSVGAKQKEPIGEFARPGRTYRPKGDPITAPDHDFTGPDTPDRHPLWCLRPGT
ncbi:hypothetical protein JOF35_005205 [Streptomyces demainii]|uniref:IstB-like ATP-binding domain-containing protein n=1 Tax=Streptomyces demainii TaxID=588122 RepID=A0ABT9KWW2_9ACTN|nr:hypothetical protein [Streptomyces demainii]